MPRFTRLHVHQDRRAAAASTACRAAARRSRDDQDAASLRDRRRGARQAAGWPPRCRRSRERRGRHQSPAAPRPRCCEANEDESRRGPRRSERLTTPRPRLMGTFNSGDTRDRAGGTAAWRTFGSTSVGRSDHANVARRSRKSRRRSGYRIPDGTLFVCGRCSTQGPLREAGVTPKGCAEHENDLFGRTRPRASWPRTSRQARVAALDEDVIAFRSRRRSLDRVSKVKARSPTSSHRSRGRPATGAAPEIRKQRIEIWASWPGSPACTGGSARSIGLED